LRQRIAATDGRERDARRSAARLFGTYSHELADWNAGHPDAPMRPEPLQKPVEEVLRAEAGSTASTNDRTAADASASTATASRITPTAPTPSADGAAPKDSTAQTPPASQNPPAAADSTTREARTRDADSEVAA
jgi:hypothetical protein